MIVVVPAVTGVRAPLVAFCEKARTAPAGCVPPVEVVTVSRSRTYTKLLKPLATMLIGLLPTFTDVAVPRVVSELIGKIVTSPGPGRAGVNPGW